MLAYTTPLWVVPGAWLFLHERLAARRIVGVTLGLGGLVVLFNPTTFDWTSREAVLGNGAIIVAAFLWAASILHIRGHRWRSTPLDLVPWEMLLRTVIVTARRAPRWCAGRGVERATGGAAALRGDSRHRRGLLGRRRWPAATSRPSPPRSACSATPVLSVVVATLWLGEPLTLVLVGAIVLILGGVAVGSMADR